MVDNIQLLSALQTLLADNVTEEISPQDLRDMLVSVYSGFVSYDDQASKLVPVAGVAGVPLKVTIDNLGGNTNEANPPYGVSLPMWDTVANVFRFNGLTLNTAILGRFDYTITTPSSFADNRVEFAFYDSVGDLVGQSPYQLPELKTAGVHRLFMVLPIFIDASLLDGHAEFHVVCSINFTVSFGSMYTIVLR